MMTRFTRVRRLMHRALLLGLYASVSSVSLAQGSVTIVGGGTFSTLSEAIDAANPGDVLLVQGLGPFPPATVDIGITIDAVNVLGFADLVIENIPAGQKFVLTGSADSTDLHIRNCSGEVVIHGRVTAFGLPGFTNDASMVVSDCVSVTIDANDITRLVIENSRVQIWNSDIRGLPVMPPFGPLAYPAVTMRNSDVTVGGSCTLLSTLAVGVGSPELPCIDMVGGTLRLIGDVFLLGGQSILEDAQGTVLFGPAIRSFGGSVVLDSAATLARTFGAPYAGDSPFTIEMRPWLSNVAISFPFSQQFDLHGNPGASAWILVSLPASRLPTPFGDFWLDPFGATHVVASGVIDSVTQEFAAAIPQLAVPLGSILHFQGVVADASGISLSNPVIVYRIIP